jgi:thioredoxin 1
MAVVNLTKDNFEETVTSNDFVVVDFWAPWCAPCRSFAPVFHDASEKHRDIVFAKINTEEEPELAGAFQIRSIPTLMIFREKVIIFAQAGALPVSALEDLLKRARELDMAEVHKVVAAQQPQQT